MPPSTDGPVVVTEALTKVYRDLRAVDDLHLEVRRGEIFGLLGPNGAGKTTTVGILTTRVVPTSGRAVVAGIDVVANPAVAKRVIGVVPQTNTLDRSLDVFDNLYYHGRYFGMSRRQAHAAAGEALERFRLADRAQAKVMALSGGMAQRLMVARAILHRPDVLFLDEPTAGLDPQSRIALWELVQELHSTGQTVVLTTHYMEEADQLCERLAIMDHGRILALDTPERLKQSLGAGTEVKIATSGDASVLAAALEDELEELGGALEPGGLEPEPAAKGVALQRRVAPGRVRLMDGTIRCLVADSGGLLPKVIDIAERHGQSVTDLSVTEPTLESVFISLTGKDLRE
jgi:ABC-2 type transport system ATP-binding protein